MNYTRNFLRQILLTILASLCTGGGLLWGQGYTLSGTVVGERREAIEGAQVILSVNDTLAAMTLTDSKGGFRIERVPKGNYTLGVFFIGYNPVEQTETIAGNSRRDFLLTPEKEVALEEVTVTGSRADVVHRTATSEIFYLSEKAKAQGDPFVALREIPRIYSDVGNRMVRMEDGERPLILVNGNRYNSGVAAIDPKEIESVEVIDVVRARYLKEGYRKILNIKLKKRTKPYLYLEGATRHNLPIRSGFGVGYFEVGNSRYALFGRAAATYTHDERSDGEQRQENTGYVKRQQGEERTDGSNYLGELQFRWMATERDYVVAHAYGTSDLKRERGWGDGFLREGRERPFDYASANEERSNLFTGTLFHKHTFGENSALETTLAYNKNHNENEGNRSESYPDWLYDYDYLYKNDRNSGKFDLNYTLDLPRGYGLTVGSLARFVSDRIRQVSDGLPIFRHKRWKEYLYADLNGGNKRFSYMFSAGVEGIWLTADRVSNHYFKPRTSASVNYSLNDHLSTRLSYTLTNTPPAESQLNPYNMSTDSLVRTKGNPYLLPSQRHEMDASITLNAKGVYLTPRASYRIYTDLVEAYGFNEEGVYVSSYRNSGRFRDLRVGGSLSYRVGSVGRIGGSAYHRVYYYERQSARKGFEASAYATFNYKRWYLGLDVTYRDYEHTALLRTRYHSPSFSQLQVSYYFTKNFYISAAIENYMGYCRTSTSLRDGTYRSDSRVRRRSASFNPWILVRYTFRKNKANEMKERKRMRSEESGIHL